MFPEAESLEMCCCFSDKAAEQKEEGEGAVHSAAGQAAGGGEEAVGACAEGPAPPQAGEGQLVTRQWVLHSSFLSLRQTTSSRVALPTTRRSSLLIISLSLLMVKDIGDTV